MDKQKITKPRQCGECTECCTLLTITQFAAPAGVSCKHLTESGCGIYGIRPCSPCREFTCGWLEGHFDEDDRPDKSGAIVWGTRSEGQNFIVVSLAENTKPPEKLLAVLDSATAPILIQKFGEEVDSAKQA